MDAILALIHRWNLPQFLYNWQTLEAGVLALIAGLITVRVINKQIETTVRLEQDRVAGEVDALRKSLAVELRQQIPWAIDVYEHLELQAGSTQPITTRALERLSLMPAPIIYPANAGKIGLLGGDAMSVVIVYTQLEIARNSVTWLAASRTPGNINRAVVLKTAETFLEACKYGLSVLPKLRTGDASHDAPDEALRKRINDVVARSPKP